MTAKVLSIVAGIALVQHWSRLPNAWEWLALVGLCLVFGYWRRWLVCVFLLAMLWAAGYAQWRLADRLPGELEGRDMTVQGYVLSLPRMTENRVAFDFVVTRAGPGIPGKIRLNWYHPGIIVKAGQSWQLTVRLKRPHGRTNPGGFDYEAWLFANGIGATGYVRPKPEPAEITPQVSLSRQLACWRQAISDRLDSALPGSAHLGIIKALGLGSQDLISRPQWALFRTTGVVHLMVISGSHISLVAGLVFFLIRRLWAWLGILSVSPQNAAALFAWSAALVYAALAGFSVPTLRAVLMLSIGLWALVRQRNTAIGQILLLALLVVVLFDPLALLSAGFWLSFAAVALLLYISGGRLGRQGYWRSAGKLHLAMALGLAPLLMLFFRQVSLVAPLANAVAVPVIGMLVTPLALLGAAVALVTPAVAAQVLLPAEYLLRATLWLLQNLAAWPLASISSPDLPGYALLFGVPAVLLFLAPRGMPGRYLALFLMLPSVFVPVDRPRTGEWRFCLLDVGQGLAGVVQTAEHVLVFDTGARYELQSDMGEAVVLPYLRARGIDRIDALFISHADNDHSGGASALMEAVPVTQVYSSAAPWADLPQGQFCRAGTHWQWDGVNFTILSPGQQMYDSGNDNSCVLRISNAQHSLLLTGDIERAAEQGLQASYGSSLQSSVLIAPHHGSKTSSSEVFLQQVSPRLILIPAGHKNRFGFPHAEVLQRYRKLDAAYFATADEGGIEIKSTGDSLSLWRARRDGRKYWMDPPPQSVADGLAVPMPE